MNNLGSWSTEGGINFRIWAPQCKSIEVMVEGGKIAPLALKHQKDGYFMGKTSELASGDLYKFRVDGQSSFPDPCSRFQPQGPHGPSQIVDPAFFKWQDEKWQKNGLQMHGQVIYELHVGTFSREGNYQGIVAELKELKELGITVIEIMPLAEFPGRWNWGYDGVLLFAPAHVYGTPDELRHLINEAHKLDIAVILDVVYNHLGPDGNYLKVFSKDYFADQYTTDWGEALNFDGHNAGPVREFFITNACYWIKEFHFDGLRLDATQNIYDKSRIHILAEITKATREAAAPKKIIFVAENESQHIHLVQPLDKGGYGIDGIWNDDFHHSANVVLKGRREAYYTDYLGHAQEFISMLKSGFLYQGQFYSWQNQMRGTYVGDDIAASQFIVFLENHDQVANSLDGRRVPYHLDSGLFRAMTTLLLLSPQTPMLFMGEEFAASSPFYFFADHKEDLAKAVLQGRKEFLSQFPSIRSAQGSIPDPKDERAFTMSKLNFVERKSHKEIYQMHKDLLKMRREDEIFSKQDRFKLDGAVLSDDAFVIRYKGEDSDRLVVINLGKDLDFSPCPLPLLAPLTKTTWECVWSTDDVRYGGRGITKAFEGNCWYIPGRGAQVFTSIPQKS